MAYRRLRKGVGKVTSARVAADGCPLVPMAVDKDIVDQSMITGFADLHGKRKAISRYVPDCRLAPPLQPDSILDHGGLPCSKLCFRLRPFIILHTNGIHSMRIHGCGCLTDDKISEDTPDDPLKFQLLRAGIWPTTQLSPRSGVTISVLKLFHALTSQAQVSAYDFHEVLGRLTCNEIKESVPVSASNSHLLHSQTMLLL